MWKGSKVYCVVNQKCPHCMEGDVFLDKNPYHLKNMTKMHARCSECNQNFEPEPNFYFGAMYVSYAYTVALFVAVYVIVDLILGLGMWAMIAALGALLVTLSPLLFRLARITWLSIFVHYDKEAISKFKSPTK